MIPYGRQFIDQQDIRAVTAVLRSPFLTQGPKVAEFEKALAKISGTKYAVAISSGTAALHLAYLAAGLKKGDEVITTPNTFVATTNMLLAVGAKPVFADIRLDTYNFDEKKLAKLITPKTRAIIPVHFAGHPCTMDSISALAKKHRLLVITDACHALGATYKNKPIGFWGDLAVFSFHPVKAITTGEGGAVITNNAHLYEQMRHLRSHGIAKNEKGFNVMTQLGYNYRLTDLQAALGLSQLDKLPKFLKKRRQITSWYQQTLSSVKEIILPQEIPPAYSGWHLYVIRTRRPEDRDLLATHLKSAGIGVNFHYPAVYTHPYYRQNGYQSVALPRMDLYHQTCLTLPCYYTLTQKEAKFVTQTIKKYFHP